MFATYVVILASFASVKSFKILVVVPTPSISHQVVFRPLIQELIDRKHEVTVVTTDPIYPHGGSPENLKEIDLHNLSYTIWLKVVYELAKKDQSNLTKMKVAYRWFSEVFIEQLKDKSVQKLLQDTKTKFDLLILESMVPGTLIFSHIFKAPVICMSTLGAFPGNMKMIGSESHPLLYPTHYHQKIYNLTIWEKIYEFYIDVASSNIRENKEIDSDKIFKGLFGINTPSLHDLKSNVHMMFLNLHPLWLHNPPVSPNILYTWGLHKSSEKKLPMDLQYYLDSSKHGVIYISFGSIFKTSEIPSEILQIFVKVLSRLPYNVLWKWDTDELPGKSENIKISKWFPQCDVLRHPNVKLFITHGGLKSTSEAINAAVPLIGIPQFADQGYNTEKYVYFKIGTKLDYKSITTENFEMAIKAILTDYNSYKTNMIRLRTQMHDQPKPALEHVTWWIEYVLRHGGVRHLRAPASNMSWAEYYELEIILLALSGFIVSGTTLLVIVYSCFLRTSQFYKLRN